MARKNTKPAFEPVFTKEAALENLSPIHCRNRDEKRRFIAVAASRTEAELRVAAAASPDSLRSLLAMADEMAEHTLAEAAICKAVANRLEYVMEAAAKAPTVQ